MENIKLDDFVNFSFISGLEYSPDGKHAGFVVHKANLDDNDYDSNIWVYQADSDSCRQLTALNKERSFIWLSDNEHIAFVGMRDPKDKERKEKGEDVTTVYKINIHGGEAQKFFQVPLMVKQIKQIDDDNLLLFVNYNANKQELSDMDDKEKAEVLKQRQEEKDYEVLEEIPYWSNGTGFTSGNRTRLYLYNLKDNKWRPLTGENLDISCAELDEAHSQVAIIGQEICGKREITNALYVLDLSNEQVKQISDAGDFRYYVAEFIDKKQLICLGSDHKHYGLNENPRFYLIDTDMDQRELLTEDLDVSVGSTIGSDCRYGMPAAVKRSGKDLYFVTTEGASSYLNRIDYGGQITKLTIESGSVDSFAVYDDQVLLVRLRKDRLQEVYKLNFEGKEKQVTQFNDWFTKERLIASLQPLDFSINDQVQIDGWVIKPANYDETKQYPAILDIHGGPKTAYGEVYYHEMQYWAAQGYFVLLCNPRGSDGKGNEFADIRGKYGTIDYDDIMQFVDTALEQYPSIDTGRLGVTGGSYGGYMTNWIIGHTNRFRAAASQRSIANWVSMGFTTDIGYFFTEDQIDSTPWQDISKLWEASPLKYVDQAKTPTLFIHSDQDYRCWLPEGLQMFTALKYHGIKSRLCLFHGENHELGRSGKPKHRIRRLQEITNWFREELNNE